MATASGSDSSGLSNHCTELSQPPYELHKAVFEGDLRTVRKLINQSPDCVKATDCHGENLSFYSLQSVVIDV